MDLKNFPNNNLRDIYRCTASTSYFCNFLPLQFLSFTENQDYTPIDTRLTLPAFSPNGSTACVLVNIVDDATQEGRESFFASLTNLNPNAVTVIEGEDVLTILILDNDCK